MRNSRKIRDIWYLKPYRINLLNYLLLVNFWIFLGILYHSMSLKKKIRKKYW